MRSIQAIQADVGKLANVINAVRTKCKKLVTELRRDHSPPEPDLSEMVENKQAPNVSYYLQGLLDVIDDDKLRDVEAELCDAATCTDETLRESW